MDLQRRDDSPSTPHQRLYCRTLMQQAELPTHRVTVLHRDLFQRNGITWCDDQGMDALLESLDRKRIGLLIAALRARVDIDEEEEET